MAAPDYVEPLPNPTRSARGVSRGSSPAHRTFRVNVITVWDHWVVEVPDASGVHAMISDIGDAESAALQAIATVLDVDPAQIRVVLSTV